MRSYLSTLVKYILNAFKYGLTNGVTEGFNNKVKVLKRNSYDIRELRDLVRYHFKLTCMITGEKNHTHNCLTVSNLKLDDVFSDIFGKSALSITEQILQHPGETFDVTPFVDSRCKTSIEEIQAAVNSAVSVE